MSATSGGGSVSEGSEAGGSSHSTMSVSDSPSTSFQANLPENVTKITLSEENSGGGFGADVTGSKINLCLDERHQKDGIVNVAFDYEEEANRGGGGGDFKSINGSDKKDRVSEAVNLELVNMVPYSNGNGTSYGVPVNGIPVKKDSEQVDISTPYDEYFVPVNEHKKYMRGEKLYVTKDKRRPTSWRRCLSWIVACTVISVVLIVAILAGTGVILSQEPNLVKEASVGRNFAGSNMKPSVTNKSPTPTTEMYTYVPRSIESEFVIDNLDFDPALKNRNSSAYQQFATNMEDQLKMLLFNKETLEFEASDVALKIVNISRDPFKVNYRIGWNYKQGVNNPPEPIKMEDVKKRLVESLARNQGYIDKYHIDREAIKVNHVIDTCQMDNGGCSHICYYNYINQQFTCTCPTHLILDTSGKNCVAWTGSSEDDAVPVPSRADVPYESTISPAQEYEFSAHHEHGVHQGVYNENDQDGNSKSSTEIDHEGPRNEHEDSDSEAEVAPEPTAEFDSDQKSIHDDRNFQSSHDTRYSEAAPEPTAETNLGGQNHQHHSIHSEYESKEPSTEPTQEPVSEQNFGSKDHEHSGHSGFVSKEHETSAEPAPEPTPDPTIGTNSEGRGHGNVYGFKDIESVAEPTPELASEPTSERDEVHHQDNSSAHSRKDHEPTAEPTPEPASEPTSERDEVHPQDNSSAYSSKDHEPTAEPTPEPVPVRTSEHDEIHYQDDSSIHNNKDHEPSAEPTPEPVPEPSIYRNNDEKKHDHVVHSIHTVKDHEPTAEPTLKPEPAIEYNSESKTNDADAYSVYVSQDHEPTAEPTPEPASEPSAERNTETIDHQHNGSSVYNPKDHEPSEEPTSAPSGELNPEGKTHNHASHSDYESRNLEAPAEPAPEPTKEDDENKGHDSFIHSLFENKNLTSATESTSELMPEGVTDEYNPHFVYESKPVLESKKDSQLELKSINKAFLETHTEPGSEVVTASEVTPQPLDPDSTNSGTSEQIETSVPSAIQAKNITSDYQPLFNESKTEYPMRIHPILQNESDVENKSDHHHMLHLEDILIKKPSMNSQDQNAADKNQSFLQNVEIKRNGEPVIEEIIINKSSKNFTEQIGPNPSHSVISGYMGNKSDTNFNRNYEGFTNQNTAAASHLDNSSTNKSVIKIEVQKDSSNQNIQPEIVTENPKIIEYTEIQQSTQKTENNERTVRPDFEESGSIKDGYETTIRSSDQHHLHSFNQEDKNFKMKEMALKTGEEEYKLVDPPQDRMPITTHPETQHEYQTIPVSVEISSSSESTPNAEKKPEVSETNIRERDMPAENPNTNSKNISIASPTENEQFQKESSDRQSLKEGRDQSKTYEISTEPHLTVTTLLSILTPEGFSKINEEHKQAILGGIQNDNKTNLKLSRTENNETTKAPEEISNNIKDEPLDNEAFNILIDKEYKNKESTPNDGKEVLNKYPNKPLKADKKKLKDYVKGEKTDSDKKAEVTARPAVTPEDFILQKHVNGNENIFDLDYSLQNEHTTKNDGGVTVVDPYGIPGVSFKPHGINNHDLSVLQTVSPDFKTETIFSSGVQEIETLRPDFKIKLLENKEGELKLDKDYKFDKDYKYEKQKVSKKKELKKKVGGKDGKNVELDDGRKYFADVSKDDWDASQEGKDITETTIIPFEKMTVQPETRVKNLSESSSEVITNHGSNFNGGKFDGFETTFQPHPNFEISTEVPGKDTTEYPKLQSENEQGDLKPPKGSSIRPRIQDGEKYTPLNESGHLLIEEPAVKSTFDMPPGTVHDHVHSQLSETLNQSNIQIRNSTSSEPENMGISGIVFDKIPEDTKTGFSEFGQNESERNTTFVYKTTHSLPEIALEGGITNFTKAHPTIIIHGQSGNLQDGHMRFVNSTLHNPGNATVISIFNGTLSHPEGHSFSFTNYTTTFHNGSTVHPTIVVRGQSGALQDGHESRFGNSTLQTYATFSTHPTENGIFKNSQVYRIQNSSLPGTVFDGKFNPEEEHNHTFTNSSGAFVHSNASTQPVFRIKGENGDFGNSTAYILENSTSGIFSGGFIGPTSIVFRNSTVFAVENTGKSETGGIREIVLEPHNVMSNDTIHFTHQMTPSFVSSGTAYKVNNYFGYISKCAAGQFQCLNGTSKRGSACISLSSKCDSINDCSDGSDEFGCIENGCAGNFQCSDGTCLKRNLVCNSILDCSDGSDEKNCESWKCEFDEFQCPSGRCIPVVWQCDNKPDCDNHTDEYNCQTSCGNDEYLCPEGWCIPLTYKCNGIKECTNGEDEQLCDCSHEEFKCQTGGCVSMKQVCNGLDDCPDRSDEWDCVKLEPSSKLLKIRSPSGNYEPVCADNWSSRYSDQVCSSLGYFSSVPIEDENSSITTETSFYILKNDTTADFNKKIIINLRKSEGNCSSGKLVEISCQQFSCGSRSMTDSSSVEARLVGGMSATAGQWPSVALLYNTRNFHSCTANVLTPRWVLASYNCLKMGNFRNKNLNEQDWKFYGGSTVFEFERESAEIRQILSIISHPQVKFNQFLFTNDLALIELDQSLQFTSNLGAVCLPEQEMQPRQICVTAGWGMNTPEDRAIRQQLQYLPVPTMNLTECNSTEHYSGFITDDKICAGYNSAQKSLCYNEEGAPLMCVNDKGEWELQGVLSYHSNCGRGSHPSIFSSITPVTDWIKKTIGNNFERKVLAVTNR